MKHLKSIIAILALSLTLGMGTAQAQDKIAHIASQELIEAMPAYKSAVSELTKLQETYVTDIKAMLATLQAKVKKLDAQAQAEQWGPERIQQETLGIQEDEQKIQDFRQAGSKEVDDKRAALLKPIYEKARTTVQKVARAKGYNYVLDSTTGTGVIMADGYDLMADVKRELGI